MTDHSTPLQPGEVRTHTVDGQTFQVMHTGNGMYTQASVRDGGPTRVLGTMPIESEALRIYADAIAQAEADWADVDTDEDGQMFIGAASGELVTPGADRPYVPGHPMADRESADMPAEPTQPWYFTFGGDHTHPLTGENLRRAYVVVTGTHDGARAALVAVFGCAWSFQYSSADMAGVETYGLREVALRPANTPAEARTGVSDRVAAALDELSSLRYDLAGAAGTRAATAARIADVMAILRGER